MITAARIVLATIVLVPASAGTSTTRPTIALTASPAHVSLLGSGRAMVHVADSGSSPVVVDVERAGFALDLRGRPRILPRGGSRTASWLTVRPRRFALRPGGSAPITISSRLPARVEPGDHPELVLLTTRPTRHAGVAVRMRLGVVVDVRAPGRVVRQLVLRALHVRQAPRLRILELLVANRGNVTESFGRGRLTVTLQRQGRVLARLNGEARELLPRTRGIVELRYRGPVRGRVIALARIAYEGGAGVAIRSFRLRL
jgi:hypothetical protein